MDYDLKLLTKLETLTNQKILLIAIAKSGGFMRPADNEDIAIVAHRISKKSFSWNKHSEFIDLEKVRSSVRYINRRAGNELVSGSTKIGWMLTEAGAGVISSYCDAIDGLGEWLEIDKLDNEAARLSAHPAYEKMRSGEKGNITEDEIKSFFHVPAVKEVYKHNLVQRVKAVFSACNDNIYMVASTNNDCHDIVNMLARRY